MPSAVIYTTIACGYCVRAKRLLKDKQVPFDEVDVSYDAQKRSAMMEKAGGRVTVPQIFVGDTHVGGYEELYDLERSGKLDPLLSAA